MTGDEETRRRALADVPTRHAPGGDSTSGASGRVLASVNSTVLIPEKLAIISTTLFFTNLVLIFLD